MRKLLLLTMAALLFAPAAFAQQPTEGGDDDKPVTAPPTPPDADTPAGQDKADAPPLRDDYEPREKISRDKAESFPPDI